MPYPNLTHPHCPCLAVLLNSTQGCESGGSSGAASATGRGGGARGGAGPSAPAPAPIPAPAPTSSEDGEFTSKLDALRSVTGLGALQPRAVFTALRKYSTDGSLKREQFTRYLPACLLCLPACLPVCACLPLPLPASACLPACLLYLGNPEGHLSALSLMN